MEGTIGLTSVIGVVFAVVAGATLVGVLVWVAVSAYRLLQPEDPPVVLEFFPVEDKRHFHSGLREIVKTQNDYLEDREIIPSVDRPFSQFTPTAQWSDDLWKRRN